MAKKSLKLGPESKAGVEVTDRNVTVAADKDNFVSVDESGIYIVGPQSWVTTPENIRVAGLWTQNTAYRQMIPSTIVTPIPNLVVNPPIKGIKMIAESVALMKKLLI
jgi:hypothetical protein